MFITLGYNFLSDRNAIDPSPILSDKDNYTVTKLQNGIFDHWNVTRDVQSPYTSEISEKWTPMTVMDANFNGDLIAGNLDYALSQISGFKVKRRKTTDFNWITLAYIPIDTSQDQITYQDNLATSGVEYEYALVSIVGGVEGNYITDTIGAEFDGVFICDAETVYKFYAGVEYGAGERVQKVGVFEPFGRRYPVVVSNALTNYEKGSFSGTVLPVGYLHDGNLNRLAMVQERKELLDFLTNKRAKILKDWNGNSWLLIIIDSPSIAYESKFGMGIANVGADYVEIGDSNSQEDLYNAGLISEVE